jgi:5-oxoprolinase (ATP-hydrolysing) subunit A
MRCDSILLHGDNEKAVLFAGRVRDRLVASGLTIAPMAEVVAERTAASATE